MKRYDTRIALQLVCLLTVSTCFAGSDDARITHGPMLGRLSDHGVGVWARTSDSGEFRVRYGLSPNALKMTSAAATTELERDNTGWVHVDGLSSNTRYYYQLEVPGSQATVPPVGSFRTLPSDESFRDSDVNPRGLFNFSFEYACGNKPQFGPEGTPPRPTYVTMLREIANDIDFAILNGDWLYEAERDYSVPQWLDQVGQTDGDLPESVRLAPGVVGVWQNYKYYLDTDPNLASWHREVPSFFTMDDHEVLNDLGGTGEIGYRNARTLFRDAGVKAWHDYLGWSMPIEFTQDLHFSTATLQAGSTILTDPTSDFSTLDLAQAGTLHVHWGENSKSGDPNAAVYAIEEVLDKNRLRIRPAAKADTQSTYSIGRRGYSQKRVGNCHFFFLDTRSDRGLHDKDNPFRPGLSMLGIPQRTWLKRSMKASDADFFFVVSSVNFMIPHVAPKGQSGKDEAWTSYLEEREGLIDFWDDLGRPVLVLTGDLHNSMAIKITDRVWEFASGPHSSTNHSAPHEANRPPNGPYQHGPRPCEIRWSSYVRGEMGRSVRLPHYCVVQINNVFQNPMPDGGEQWIAFPRPHVIFQYYEGHTGKLAYAEAVFSTDETKNVE